MIDSLDYHTLPSKGRVVNLICSEKEQMFVCRAAQQNNQFQICVKTCCLLTKQHPFIFCQRLSILSGHCAYTDALQLFCKDDLYHYIRDRGCTVCSWTGSVREVVSFVSPVGSKIIIGLPNKLIYFLAIQTHRVRTNFGIHIFGAPTENTEDSFVAFLARSFTKTETILPACNK